MRERAPIVRMFTCLMGGGAGGDLRDEARDVGEDRGVEARAKDDDDDDEGGLVPVAEEESRTRGVRDAQYMSSADARGSSTADASEAQMRARRTA